MEGGGGSRRASREPAVNLGFRQAHDLDDLARGRPALDHTNRRDGNAERLGNRRFNGGVGLPALGLRGHPYLESVAQPAGDAIARRRRDDFDQQLNCRVSIAQSALTSTRPVGQPCAALLQEPDDGALLFAGVRRSASSAPRG